MNNKCICCIGLPKSGTTHLTQILYNTNVKIHHSKNNIYEANLKDIIDQNDTLNNCFFKKPNIIFNKFQIKRLMEYLLRIKNKCLITIFLTDFNKCLYKLYKLKTSSNRDTTSHEYIDYSEWINNESQLLKKNTNIEIFSKVEKNILYLINEIKFIKNIDLIIFKEKKYSHNDILTKINVKGFNLKLQPKTVINMNNNFIWFKTHKVDINIISTIYQIEQLPIKKIKYYSFNLDKIDCDKGRHFNFSIKDINLYDSENNLITSNISDIVNNLNNYFLIKINNKKFFFKNNTISEENLLNRDIQEYPNHEILNTLYNNLKNNSQIIPYLV